MKRTKINQLKKLNWRGRRVHKIQIKREKKIIRINRLLRNNQIRIIVQGLWVKELNRGLFI